MTTAGNCPHCGAWRGPGPTCPACGQAYNAPPSRPVQPSPPVPPVQPRQPQSAQPGPAYVGPQAPGVGTAAKQGFGWALGCLVFVILLVVILIFIGSRPSAVSTPQGRTATGTTASPATATAGEPSLIGPTASPAAQ